MPEVLLGIWCLGLTASVVLWFRQWHQLRAIQRAGHEIASHGDWHQVVTTQTAAEFRADVRTAKAVLEDLTGRRIVGYRAPSFSIAPDRAWASVKVISGLTPIFGYVHEKGGCR